MFEPANRPLPEDPNELDKAIRPYRLMVKPLLGGLSRLYRYIGTDPLDKDEMEGGELAFGALMYQMGGTLDARILVMLWLAGTGLPRALQYLDKKENEKKAARVGEKEVTGAVVRVTGRPAGVSEQ